MSRLTRNTALSNINLMDDKGTMKKNSNIPVMKRKAEVELKKEGANKRAALGNITNARQGPGPGDGKDPSAGTMKKLTGIIKGSKGSLALRNKETKKSTLKKPVPAVKKNTEQKNSENSKLSSSSSSEEALLCVFPDSDSNSSSEEKIVDAVRSPPRPIPPEGIEDFDLENIADPQQHSEYAMETFQYYKDREAKFLVPHYMEVQTEITDAMRSILVDWLVEVQESFELNHETLYTAVKMTDLYLSKKQVKKEDLQLVGATACLIACKVDERIPPMVDDFLYVCDDAYSRDQLMKMERKMLSVVGFDLGYSLSYRFLRRYGRVCRITMPVLTLARYILEMSLMEYRLNVEVSESELAAAALILALKMKNIEGWASTLKYYSGLDFTKVEVVLQQVLAMMQRPHKENLKTVRSKYSHKVFHEVATTPVPTSVTLTIEG